MECNMFSQWWFYFSINTTCMKRHWAEVVFAAVFAFAGASRVYVFPGCRKSDDVRYLLCVSIFLVFPLSQISLVCVSLWPSILGVCVTNTSWVTWFLGSWLSRSKSHRLQCRVSEEPASHHMALSRNGHPVYGHWIVMYWTWNFGGAYAIISLVFGQTHVTRLWQVQASDEYLKKWNLTWLRMVAEAHWRYECVWRWEHPSNCNSSAQYDDSINMNDMTFGGTLSSDKAGTFTGRPNIWE